MWKLAYGVLTSNIACGVHAGDASSMRRTVQLAPATVIWRSVQTRGAAGSEAGGRREQPFRRFVQEIMFHKWAS